MQNKRDLREKCSEVSAEWRGGLSLGGVNGGGVDRIG